MSVQYNKLIVLLIYSIQSLIYNRINVLCDSIKPPYLYTQQDHGIRIKLLHYEKYYWYNRLIGFWASERMGTCRAHFTVLLLLLHEISTSILYSGIYRCKIYSHYCIWSYSYSLLQEHYEKVIYKKKTLRGFGPLANYADRSTAASWLSSTNFCG
jgi:hypothetical protein